LYKPIEVLEVWSEEIEQEVGFDPSTANTECMHLVSTWDEKWFEEGVNGVCRVGCTNHLRSWKSKVKRLSRRWGFDSSTADTE
jgi:hypothetical protein